MSEGVDIDWTYDVPSGKWMFIARCGDEFFATVCGRKNPVNEPGYLEYLKTAATKAFKERGVL